MTTTDRDQLIRLALTPSADVTAPADLGDAIYDEILVTPQQRGGLFRVGRLGWVPAPSATLVTLALLTLLGVGLLIVALSRPPVPPILAMYHGGPDRTGVMPGPGPAGEPFIEWDVARPGPLPFNSMPLPVGDRVIVGDGSGVLAALDAATGGVVWDVDLGSPIRASPALAGDLVITGTDAGEVVATRLAGGAEAWRRTLDGSPVLASLLVVGTSVYAGTEAGTFAVLEAGTGEVERSLILPGAVTRGPGHADGVVYVGAAGGQVRAIDAGSGAERWAVDIGDGEVGTPTVGGGLVFAGRGLLAQDGPHDLVAMRIEDGSIAWSFEAPSGQQLHMGGLAGGRAFAVSEDGSLTALDAAKGEVIWTTVLGEKLATPVGIVGDVLYVSAERHLVRAVDARSGDIIWTREIVGNGAVPAVVDGRVFVGTDLGRVISIAGSE